MVDDPRRPVGGPPAGPSPGPGGPSARARRFIDLYGWRAYAVPLLAVATLLTLLDVASSADPPSAGPPATSSRPALSGPTGSPTSAPVASTTAAAGESEPTDTATATPTAVPDVVQRGTGEVGVVPGRSALLGTGGPTYTFQVAVEGGIGMDGAQFAAEVETILSDPRSWGAQGRLSFQRVSGPSDFRVLLVSPDNVNSFCPGLDTGGYTSCRSGQNTVINLARWLTAVPEYEGDLGTYRQYVVNHEVGHFLGHGHELCPGPGERAPVMQQQTLGLQGCVKNPWPFPDAG